MPPKESPYPADWARIAEKDLGRSKHLLSIHDPEAAGFFLQQAVEKYLKAYLLSTGWKLLRIHDLEPLLNQVVKSDPTLEKYRSSIQQITGFYIIERYPLVLGAHLTEVEVSKVLAEVEGLLDVLRKKL